MLEIFNVTNVSLLIVCLWLFLSRAAWIGRTQRALNAVSEAREVVGHTEKRLAIYQREIERLLPDREAKETEWAASELEG